MKFLKNSVVSRYDILTGLALGISLHNNILAITVTFFCPEGFWPFSFLQLSGK